MSENFYECPEGANFELVLEAGDRDCLDLIAEACGSTVKAIQANNPEVDFEALEPEQIIQLPFPRGRCASGNIYIARRGDTLAGIALRFGVSEQALLRENPLLVIIGVRPGLPICIPTPQPVICPGGFFYTVVAGDTIFSIAARFNTTVGAILQANPGLDPNRLFVGQRICIPAPQPVQCPGGFFYTVVAGDTLFSIAARFNTTVGAILQANPGLDPNRLFVGQRICIPAPQPVPCPGGFFYTVVAGDTLFAIATRFNTTVNAILQANPGVDPNRLFVGQQLCIPVAPPTACPGFFYTVVVGDTLNSIAARFNTTVPAILRVNPGLNPDFIVIGQRLCIPSTPTPPACPGFSYTVVAGDTLFAIANRFNTTVNAILNVNPGLDPNSLFVGQQICIPR